MIHLKQSIMNTDLELWNYLKNLDSGNISLMFWNVWHEHDQVESDSEL